MFWDTFFDVVSLATSIVDVIQNPSDPWAWAGLIGDAVDVLVPFVSGVGETTKALKVANKVDDVVDTVDDVYDTAKAVDKGIDASKAAKKIHGNSLKSTKTNYGYVMLDKEGNIMKFGETTAYTLKSAFVTYTEVIAPTGWKCSVIPSSGRCYGPTSCPHPFLQPCATLLVVATGKSH